MTVRLPLRLQDTSDFQEMSSTDENFLAYHTGLAFAQYDSADIGAIGFLNSGSSTDRLIGSIANTAFDSAVGTLEAFTQYQIKLVMRTNNTSRIPKFQDLRAIALAV